MVTYAPPAGMGSPHSSQGVALIKERSEGPPEWLRFVFGRFHRSMILMWKG